MKLSTSETNELHPSEVPLIDESNDNGPFLLLLCDNRFEKIFLDSREDISISNLKKGIAGLFQVSAVLRKSYYYFHREMNAKQNHRVMSEHFTM